jgi:ribosome-binding protein aMBF1 (putative translation factor)
MQVGSVEQLSHKVKKLRSKMGWSREQLAWQIESVYRRHKGGNYIP